MQGRVSAVAGQTAAARSQWERAAAAAGILQMPREQAGAIYEIGKSCNGDDPNRQVYLGKAAEIFEHVGATDGPVQLRRTQSPQK
jgi:hypothetical protein